MPDIKERPKDDRPNRKKRKSNVIEKQMKAAYIRNLARDKAKSSEAGEENPGEYATDRIETDAAHVARIGAETVKAGSSRLQQAYIKTRETWDEKPTAWEAVQHTTMPKNGSRTAKNRYNEAANPPETPSKHQGVRSEPQRVLWREKAHRDVIKERRTLDQPRESKPIKNASQIETHFDMRERRAAASPHAPKPAAITPQAKTPQQKKTALFPKTKAAFSPTIHPSIKPAERQAKQQTVKELTQKAGQKAAKQTEKAGERIVKAVGRTVERGMSALVGAGAGGVLLVLLLFLGAIAAIAASPFGLYFAAERNAQDAVTVAEAVAQVNADLNNRLETLQDGDYNEITVEGAPPDWTDVLAVFAVKNAGTDDGVDVATLDADRVDRLKAVFWDMTAISSEVETIDHPGEGEDEGWTEYILHITITAKSEADMRQDYALTSQQINALDELLSDRAALSALAEDLTVTRADARELLDALPDDLDPERYAVVEAACSLVGKVNYHWGGKSLVLGWDSRWGQLQKVTADGNSTTGTYRPYGLDCSGFVDWVFYNATGGAYYPGHGGGATMQHSYCTPISWEDALPGDLVFYADDEHVGIVGGRDADGKLLIVHCASSHNCVVITGAEGFATAGRPLYYSTH